MQQPARRGDEETGEHDVGEKMSALRDAREAEQEAGGERGGDRDMAPSPLGREEGEGDEREAERRVARAERAVAVALAGRDEGGVKCLSPPNSTTCDGRARPQ